MMTSRSRRDVMSVNALRDCGSHHPSRTREAAQDPTSPQESVGARQQEMLQFDVASFVRGTSARGGPSQELRMGSLAGHGR